MHAMIGPDRNPVPAQAPSAELGACWHRPDSLRSNNIDAIRFVLASSVILSHSFALPAGSDATEPLHRFTGGQRTMGGLAVDLFFMLSGFLISHSWATNPRPLPFLRKRALRVYPAFIATSLLALLLFAPLSAKEGFGVLRGLDWISVAWNVLTLRDLRIPGAFPTNPFPGAMNGSLWSVRYEFWCYLGVMGLGLIPWVARRRAVLLTLLVVSLAASFAYDALNLRLNGGLLGRVVGEPILWARLLPCFLAGMVFYRYRDAIPARPLLVLASLAALILACRVPHALSVVCPLAGAYLLFSAAFARAPGVSGVGRYGDFSYGLYVYAFPIQQSLVMALGREVQAWPLFGLSFLLTMVASVPSWYLIERPALRLKGRRTAHPPAPVSTP